MKLWQAMVLMAIAAFAYVEWVAEFMPWTLV
jgi:hypothetical protein